MTLNFSSPCVVEDGDGFYIRLQDASVYVEVRIQVAIISKDAGSLTKDKLLEAFEARRKSFEAAANRKYKAGEFDEQASRKIIWITIGEV